MKIYQYLTIVFVFLFLDNSYSQVKSKKEDKLLAPTPPMGWMTWNFFADNITEKDIKEMADAMVTSGMLEAGYNYIIIDDGWQGGRDNKNNIIPDPKKFPAGMKALAEYVHSKGLKLGIYSDAAQLTCAGYTASFEFEEQDAKIFASWGIDYLKYDYCNAPEDVETAKQRYSKMSAALRSTGRDIVFGICEWGHRKPWLWAAEAGGQLWRTTNDVRDKWKRRSTETNGEGILDIVDVNLTLDKFAGVGHWNDMDMLVIGLYGKKGPSGDLGGTGCTDVEYRSQMSLWCMLNSPLTASNDIRSMNAETKRILLNKEMIAINQDALGQAGVLQINNETWTVILKPLSDGDYALAILNRSDAAKQADFSMAQFGLKGKYEMRDVWQYKTVGKGTKWKGSVQGHETKVMRLKKVG
jgi:alpha-galactosidase